MTHVRGDTRRRSRRRWHFSEVAWALAPYDLTVVYALAAARRGDDEVRPPV